ncbi:MAG: hypothetical protein ACQET8_22660 [Bacillota bacterium]
MEDNQQQLDNQQDQQNDQNKQQEHMIPKSRFNEVNSKYKDVAAELQALKDAQAQRELDDKKQQGHFEELYNTANTELGTLKPRVEVLEGVINSLLTTKLEVIPKEYHALIPEGSPESKLAWINTAESTGLFGKQTQVNQQPVGGMTNGTQHQPPQVTKEQFETMDYHARIKLFNENPELYKKLNG